MQQPPKQHPATFYFYEKEARRQHVHPAHVMAMTMIRDVLRATGIYFRC